MYEKILQKLKLQRGQTSNVSDRSLEDLARTLESVITTDEILEKADFTNAIKSIDGNISHYTAEAVKNAAKTVEEDSKKKPEEKDTSKKKPQTNANPEEIPEWAKPLMERMEKLTNGFETMQSEKSTSTRRELLKKTFADKDGNSLPEFYTKPILTAFDNTKFDDEAAFNKYLDSIKSSNEVFIQEAKENSIRFGTPRKDVEVPEETGETEVLGDARKIVRDQKSKETKKE